MLGDAKSLDSGSGSLPLSPGPSSCQPCGLGPQFPHLQSGAEESAHLRGSAWRVAGPSYIGAGTGGLSVFQWCRSKSAEGLVLCSQLH